MVVKTASNIPELEFIKEHAIMQTWAISREFELCEQPLYVRKHVKVRMQKVLVRPLRLRFQLDVIAWMTDRNQVARTYIELWESRFREEVVYFVNLPKRAKWAVLSRTLDTFIGPPSRTFLIDQPGVIEGA
jgi:hypothetical protein